MAFLKFLTAFGMSLLLCNTVSSDNIRHYHGYKVFRIFPKTPSHYQALKELVLQDKYDFWKEPTSQNGPCDIMLSPSEQPEILNFLQYHEMPFKITIPDLEALLENERQRKASHTINYGEMDWTEYHTWDEVNNWLSNLVATNNLITSQSYGQSYENRSLLVYKVSSGPGNKVGFWIDATIHAREHITTAVITYIINELVQNSTKYTEILNQVDFYFAPFINPDGFVHTHEVDRMWRKTRSNWSNSPFPQCVGVDANRNFGVHWGEPDGSSPLPCNGGYHGPEPYSEPETRAVRDYILNQAGNHNVSWNAFVTLHSYSQLWMSPWGYTRNLTEDHTELMRVANAAVETLQSYYNTSYVTGNAADILYFMSGCSLDWAKAEGGFKYAYLIELRDTGDYGFLLPPEQIVPTAEETWAGIQVVAKEMIR